MSRNRTRLWEFSLRVRGASMEPARDEPEQDKRPRKHRAKESASMEPARDEPEQYHSFTALFPSQGASMEPARDEPEQPDRPLVRRLRHTCLNGAGSG